MNGSSTIPTNAPGLYLVPPADPDRRVAHRHRLRGATVKVAIERAPADTARGRVRDISITGGVFIETRSPLPVRTRVRLRASASVDSLMTFIGTVVRSDAEGMAVMVEIDPAGAEFFRVLVENACSETPNLALAMHLAETDGDTTEVQLSRAWVAVRSSPDDPAVHQRFIDQCLAAKRLDFALDRLRGLQAAGPIGPEVERSLENVGRILAFMGLSRAPKIEEPKKRVRWPMIILMAVLAGGALTKISRMTIEARGEHVSHRR